MTAAAADAVTVSFTTVAVTAMVGGCGVRGSAVPAPSDGEPSGVGSGTSVRVALDEFAGSAGVAARIPVASSCAAVGPCEGASVDAGSVAAWLVVGWSALPFAVVSAALSAVDSGWHITAPWFADSPRLHCEQDDEPIFD